MTKTPLCLSLVFSLLLPSPGLWAADVNPVLTADPVVLFSQRAQGVLKTLERPAAHLKAKAYDAADHEVVKTGLASLADLVVPIQVKLPKIAEAVAGASAAENAYWTAASQSAVKPDLLAAGLLDKLELMASGFSLLLDQPGVTLDAERRAKLAGQGTALDGMRQDFGQALKNGDVSSMSGLLGSIYKERGAGGDESLVAGATRPGAMAANPGRSAVVAPQKGFKPSDVPAMTPQDSVPEGPSAVARGLTALQAQEAALLAGEKALGLVWPSGRPLVKAPLISVQREIRLLQAAEAGQEWLKENQGALGEKGQKISQQFDAALFKGTAEERRQSLLQAQRELDGLLDKNKSPAEIDLKALGKDATPEQILAVLSKDPAYFKARGMWAQYVQFNQQHVKEFPSGARFSADELGFPGQNIITIAEHGGRKGLLTSPTHFESFDGRYTRDEIENDKQKFIVEKHQDGPRQIITTYDAKGVKLFAEVIEVLDAAKGRLVRYPQDKKWPRTTGREVPGKGFIVEKIENEDGTSREPAGGAASGVWVLKGKDGKAAGWALGPEALAGLNDPAKRDASADALGRLVVSQGFSATGNGKQDDYQGQAVASLFKDVFKHNRGGDVSVYFDRAEGKIIINEVHPDGVRQTVARFEETQTGWGVGDGIKPVGLSMYVRNARSLDDKEAQFTKIFQYLGNWGREMTSMKVEDNLDSIWSYVRGPKVTETPIVTRMYRDSQGAWDRNRKDVVTRKDQLQVVFDGPGIVGATGQAVGALGGGIVDFTAAGISVSLAANPLYLGAVKLSGGDVAYAQKDLLQRAAANGFTENRLISAFGADESRAAVRKKLEIDPNQAVHNVDKEMTALGSPTMGAVLKGGVNFADQVPLMLAGMGGLKYVATLGNMGKVAAVGAGVVMGGQGIYHLGMSGYDFNLARKNFNENDPASKQEYYSQLANLVGQAPSAVMMVAGGWQAVKAGRGKAPAVEAPAATPGINAPAAPAGKSLWTWDLTPQWLANADAKLPGLMRTTRPGAWVADKLNMPKAPPVENLPPPAVKGGPNTTETPVYDANNPRMASNRTAVEAATDEMFKLRAKNGGQQKSIPAEELTAQFEKTPDLPAVDKGNPASVAARNDAVGKFAQEYLGLKEPPTVKAPGTDALSGADIYLIQDGAGKTVAVYKIFNKQGAHEVMRELGAVATLDGMGANPGLGLQRSAVVKPLGAFKVGEGGKVGYMMEGAPGQDIYGAIKAIKAAPTPAARVEALESVAGDMKTVARAMAEIHTKGKRTVLEPAQKVEMVDKALANLEALRKPTAERSWTISEEVYQNLKGKLEASGAEFSKGSSQGTVIHGDAHPGNFFIDKNGKVSLIDVETAMESLNVSQRGTASPAADVGRFVESIRINNKAKGLNLTEAEMASLETAFTKAYMRETGVNPAQFSSQIEFYRAKMGVTVLKFAKTEGDFTTFLKTISEQPAAKLPMAPKAPAPGAKLTGEPAWVNPLEKPQNIRALTAQNEMAKVLAENEYRVHQNGEKMGADYQVNGRGYDAYAPEKGTSARNIASTLEGKIGKGQANNFVLGLEEGSIGLDALKVQFSKWPLSGLGDVIVIRGGKVIPLVQGGQVIPSAGSH